MPQTALSTMTPVAYSHISNAGTTAIKTNAGALLSMNVNSATGASTLILYDQTSVTPGTVIVGSFAFGTADILPLRLSIGPDGGLLFKNGLLAVTTGTVDLTVGFR